MKIVVLICILQSYMCVCLSWNSIPTVAIAAITFMGERSVAEEIPPTGLVNLIVRRGTKQQDFYALADEIRKKNADKSNFRATIERVLVNMKIISVRDMSKEAFAYLKNHKLVKFIEQSKDSDL